MDRMEKLLNRLSITEKVIRSLVTTPNVKQSVVEKKLELLEDLVTDIPSAGHDLLEQWNQTVVELWTAYARKDEPKSESLADSALDTSTSVCVDSDKTLFPSPPSSEHISSTYTKQPSLGEIDLPSNYDVPLSAENSISKPLPTIANENNFNDGFQISTQPESNLNSSFLKIDASVADTSVKNLLSDDYSTANIDNDAKSTQSYNFDRSSTNSRQRDFDQHSTNSSKVEKPQNTFGTFAKRSIESVYDTIENIFSKLEPVDDSRNLEAMKELTKAVRMAEIELKPYWQMAAAQNRVKSYIIPKLPNNIRNNFFRQPPLRQSVWHLLQYLQKYLVSQYVSICSSDQELLEAIKSFVSLKNFCTSCKFIGHVAERCRQPPHSYSHSDNRESAFYSSTSKSSNGDNSSTSLPESNKDDFANSSKASQDFLKDNATVNQSTSNANISKNNLDDFDWGSDPVEEENSTSMPTTANQPNESSNFNKVPNQKNVDFGSKPTDVKRDYLGHNSTATQVKPALASTAVYQSNYNSNGSFSRIQKVVKDQDFDWGSEPVEDEYSAPAVTKLNVNSKANENNSSKIINDKDFDWGSEPVEEHSVPVATAIHESNVQLKTNENNNSSKMQKIIDDKDFDWGSDPVEDEHSVSMSAGVTQSNTDKNSNSSKMQKIIDDKDFDWGSDPVETDDCAPALTTKSNNVASNSLLMEVPKSNKNNNFAFVSSQSNGNRNYHNRDYSLKFNSGQSSAQASTVFDQAKATFNSSASHVNQSRAPLIHPPPMANTKQVTVSELVAILKRAFEKLEPVQTQHDVISMHALIALTAKSIKLSEHFSRSDQCQLLDAIFRMACNKLPRDFMVAYNEEYKNSPSAFNLSEFMNKRILQRMNHSAIQDHYESRFYCSFCRTNGHKVDSCTWRKSLLCVQCFQYGHAQNVCKSAPIPFERLINLIDM